MSNSSSPSPVFPSTPKLQLPVPWDFPRWSIIRHLQDIGLQAASRYATGLTLDLGGHKVRQRGFFKLESIPNMTRICMNLSDSHSPDVRGDAHALPFESNAFETLWMVSVLYFCSDPHAVLQEATRVLKPGGYLVMYEPFNLVTELENDYCRFTPGGMRFLAEKSGLVPVELIHCGGLLAVILSAINDQAYYRAGRGFRGRWVTRILAPFLPTLLSLDNRLCGKDSDLRRFTTGWILVSQKPVTS